MKYWLHPQNFVEKKKNQNRFINSFEKILEQIIVKFNVH